MPSPELVNPEKIKYLTIQQVNKVIEQAEKNVRDYALLILAYNHGLRISEIGQLQITDINLETKRIHTQRVKGGINSSYMLSERAYVAVKGWLKVRGMKSGPLFPSRKSVMEDGERGISKQYLDSIYRDYAKKAGIPIGFRNFHALRHSIAVHMVDRDIPLPQIQDWLGHKNIQSTSIYAKVSDFKRDETARRMWEEEEKKKEKELERKGGTGIDWKRNTKK